MDQRGGRSWEELNARGRDVLVAEWMGWRLVEWLNDVPMMIPPEGGSDRAPPHFTTDIAAAWLVVEEMYKRGLNVSVTADHGWRATWECCIHMPGSSEQWPSADADTPMLAICRAALKAAGVL